MRLGEGIDWMGSLFQPAGELPSHLAASLLEQSPADCRRRAVECRDLATSCCTDDAANILRELAAEFDQRALLLERRRPAPIGSGRY
jgi:hypothetical protein